MGSTVIQILIEQIISTKVQNHRISSTKWFGVLIELILFLFSSTKRF